MNIRRILMTIADNQLAWAPDDRHQGEKKAYRKGVWDGLQMAYDIITEGFTTSDPDEEEDPIQSSLEEMRLR